MILGCDSRSGSFVCKVILHEMNGSKEQRKQLAHNDFHH